MKETKADSISSVARRVSIEPTQSRCTAFQSAWLARNQLSHSSWKQSGHPLLPRRPSAYHRILNDHARRVQILRVSANGNGQEPTNIGGGNNGSEKTSKQVDPGIAKEKLVRIITELINDDAQIQEVERLILQLEGLGMTPITEGFTEIGLAGNWKLLFSSTRTRPKSRIRIRKIGQTIDPEEKKLINKANWSFTAKDGIHLINANLSVNCSYKFVGPGRFDVAVEGHKVTILGSDDGEKYDLPEDLKALIGELQLALPIDFFDPSGLVDVSYMEPNFRLARFVGKRIAGVRNIFVRDVSDNG